ncbi:hypothetical protein ES708_10403 [subsurface metagenome]
MLCYIILAMEEIIPPELMDSRRLDVFLAWLRGLRIDAPDKKQMLRWWADRVGVELTGDMVTRAGIERR